MELEEVVNGGCGIGKAQRIRRKGRDERKIYRIHEWIFENKEILCQGLMPLLISLISHRHQCSFPGLSLYFLHLICFFFQLNPMRKFKKGREIYNM